MRGGNLVELLQDRARSDNCFLRWDGFSATHRYAMVELERLSRDPVWLDKAIRVVDRLVREVNGKQKGKSSE